MTGRSLVKVDGVLLRSFPQTRRSVASRWAAVSPDELEYSDIEYGPYSAFSSENALGGSINLITRMPTSKENTIKTTYFSQEFDL